MRERHLSLIVIFDDRRGIKKNAGVHFPFLLDHRDDI